MVMGNNVKVKAPKSSAKEFQSASKATEKSQEQHVTKMNHKKKKKGK